MDFFSYPRVFSDRVLCWKAIASYIDRNIPTTVYLIIEYYCPWLVYHDLANYEYPRVCQDV